MNIADINAEARELCDADNTSLTDATLLRRVNTALETVVSWIINADGTWQFDDSNRADYPIGTGTLSEGVEVYAFASEYLQVERIEVLNAGGTWEKLSPLDFNEIEMPLSEYFASTGMPTHYDINSDTIRLYPAPTATAVTLASGFKVYFKRTAELFTSAHVTTGTRVAGFPSPFHIILPYMMSIPFCVTYKKDRVVPFERKVAEIKKELIAHYGQREKDRRKIITTKFTRFR